MAEHGRIIEKLVKSTIFFFLILVIFRAWFTFGPLASGDLPYYFRETLEERFSPPLAWDGEYKVPFLFYYPPLFLTGLLAKLGLNPSQVTQLVWFWPFLALTVFSSWYLVKTLFPKEKSLILGPLVFLFNTYILMIMGGAQVGVALAYALSPLVLCAFIKVMQDPTHRRQLIAGLVLAAQVSFDPRLPLITMGAVFLYAFFRYGFAPKTYLKIFVLPILVAASAHFYWLLPTVLVRQAALPAGYGEERWVEFLSFASFSGSLGLLHPNWPENIFGKIYFMRWEFLVLPIIAYGGLLFVNRTRRATNEKRIDTNILYFALLGLLGAFLAKGINPPFGQVYSWLFKNLPGMDMFRDPTKFYTLVALSYSVLIPYSVSNVYGWLSLKLKVKSEKLQSKVKSYLPNLFLIFAISYLLFLIRPAWLGQLGGTFKIREVPQEYVALKDFLSSQPEFFRTLWIPQRQRFGFYSNSHPALSASEFVSADVCQPPLCGLAEERKKPPKFDPTVTPETEILEKVRDYSLSYFNHPQAPEVFAQMGIKYVIVPYDSEGEIFLQDRKYSDEERQEYIKFLDQTPWLKTTEIVPRGLNDLNHLNKITLYKISNPKDHFFIDGEVPLETRWKMINPTEYEVEVKNATQPFTLVFSETYDGLWQAKIDREIIPSEKIYEALNSFKIDKKGDFDIIVEFTAQKYVWWGLVVSVGTFIISFLFLLRSKIASE